MKLQEVEQDLEMRYAAFRASSTRKAKTPFGKLAQKIDRWLYRDEQEYLEDPAMPHDKRVVMIDALSRLWNRCGYTRGYLKLLEPLVLKLHQQKPSYAIKIMDLGAGGGGLLRALYRWTQKKKIPVELYGLDLSRDFVQSTQANLARQGVPVTMIQGDASDPSQWADNQVDIVISNQVLHHIRSAEKVALFLSEAYRVAGYGWMIVDLNRALRGVALMGMAFLFRMPLPVITDGVKSVRRAYRPDEINFLIREIRKVKPVGAMICRPYPLYPYWFIRGTKHQVSKKFL